MKFPQDLLALLLIPILVIVLGWILAHALL
jgi:hypothetical protein